MVSFRERPYQKESKSSIVAALRQSRSALIVLPTGSGKSVIFANVISMARGRCLVLAHRDELIRQAADKIKIATGEYPEVEKAHEFATRNGTATVVASVQTLHKKKRLHQFPKDAFSLIIVDEAHRSAKKNKSYSNILEYFAGAKVLGVTATPDRHDEEMIVGPGKVFEIAAYEYHMRQAILDGWLVPVRQKFLTVKSLDLTKIAIKPGPNGKDYDENELAEILSQEKNLHAVVEPAMREIGDRQSIVFSANVAHGKALCEIFNRYKDRCAVMLHGGDRRKGDFVDRQVDRFKSGEFQFLVNCMLFTEGFDYWNVGAIVMARPTKSRTVYSQCVGRGTRPDPGCGIDACDDPDGRRELISGSRKKDLIVLDCVGAGRHLDLSISVADIMARGSEDKITAAVVARAKTLADEGEEDVEKCLEMARQMLDEEARKRVAAKTQYTVEEVDPFRIFEVAATLASPKQRKLIVALSGQEPHRGLTSKDASRIIMSLGSRPATIQPQQVARLKAMQVDPNLRWSWRYANMMLAKFEAVGAHVGSSKE